MARRFAVSQIYDTVHSAKMRKYTDWLLVVWHYAIENLSRFIMLLDAGLRKNTQCIVFGSFHLSVAYSKVLFFIFTCSTMSFLLLLHFAHVAIYTW